MLAVEIVGYAARGISHSEAPHLSLGPYVIQTLLLLVAPPLFAASLYMILGRVIVSVDGEYYSLIKRRWLTKSFVSSDVVCFFIQLGGMYEACCAFLCREAVLTLYRCRHYGQLNGKDGHDRILHRFSGPASPDHHFLLLHLGGVDLSSSIRSCTNSTGCPRSIFAAM